MNIVLELNKMPFIRCFEDAVPSLLVHAMLSIGRARESSAHFDTQYYTLLSYKTSPLISLSAPS